MEDTGSVVQNIHPVKPPLAQKGLRPHNGGQVGFIYGELQA